jgi:hypothetical protein
MISRYDFSKIKQSDTGKRVRESLTLPVIEDRDDDVYIITNTTDRLDSLAFRFYGNAKYWWIIAIVNNLGKGTIVVEPGLQLRIPANPSVVITELDNSNT